MYTYTYVPIISPLGARLFLFRAQRAAPGLYICSNQRGRLLQNQGDAAGRSHQNGVYVYTSSTYLYLPILTYA
jgi:hypothetical protein